MVVSSSAPNLFTRRYGPTLTWGILQNPWRLDPGNAPVIPVETHRLLTKTLGDWPTISDRHARQTRWQEIIDTVDYRNLTTCPPDFQAVAYSCSHNESRPRFFASFHGILAGHDGTGPRYINEMSTVCPNLLVTTKANHRNEQGEDATPTTLDHVTHYTMEIQALGGTACFRIDTTKRLPVLLLHEITASLFYRGIDERRDVQQVVAMLSNLPEIPYDEDHLFFPQTLKNELAPVVSLRRFSGNSRQTQASTAI